MSLTSDSIASHEFTAVLMSMKRFEVLKIRFKLVTPVLLGHPWIFFDSLVAHTLLRSALGDEFYNLPSKYPLLELTESLDMPIRKVFYDGSKYFFDCSVSIIDGQFYPYKHMFVTHIRKRIYEKEIHNVKTRKTKVEVAKGPFRLFDIKYIYVPCKEVAFYANAVESEIVEVLKSINALGKKRAVGFGFVKGFDYEKTDLRIAYVLPDSTAARPVPAKLVDTDETAKRFGHTDLVAQSIRPPYWDTRQRNIELCTVPGKRYVFSSLP